MGREDKRDEESIYHAAAARPAGERASYLEQACDGDPVLLARVRALLRSRDEVGDFLEAPALCPNVVLDESPLVEGQVAVQVRQKMVWVRLVCFRFPSMAFSVRQAPLAVRWASSHPMGCLLEKLYPVAGRLMRWIPLCWENSYLWVWP